MSVQFSPTTDDGLATQAATFGLDGSFTMSCRVFINVFPAPTTFFPMFAKITGSEVIWGIGDFSGDWRQFLQIENDSGFTTGNASSADLTTGTWHHLVVTYEDATDEVKYYLDGVLSVTRTRTTVMSETSQAVLIGRRNASQEASANYEDLAVWNYLLPEDRIATLAKQFVAGFFPAGLTGWWPLHVPGDSAFNEAVAAGDLGLEDFSGNGNPCDDAINGNPDWRTSTPRLHWPSDPYHTTGVVEAPAGNAMPMAMNHYRRRRAC